MDHWGDPWADDTDTTTHTTIATPTKVAEPRPPPSTTLTPSEKPAPSVLNGFLDDAGWGSNAWAVTPSPRKDGADGGFSWEQEGTKKSWNAPSEKDVVGERSEEEGFSASAPLPGKEEDIVEDAGANGVEHMPDWDAPSIHDDHVRHESTKNEAGNEWSRVEEVVEESKDAENGVSETSDSATTIQADDTPLRTETEISGESLREDDASTRSSESHSEGSHNEAVTESPRTSVEEEQAAGKSADVMHEDSKASEDVGQSEEQHEEVEQDLEDEFGEFEDEVAQEAAEAQLVVETTHDQPKISSKESEEDMASETQDASAESIAMLRAGPLGSFILDSELMAELFPPAKDNPEVEDPPDDPVSSTSARKAWYRLTRKQTMREYNNGALDDNYIRVTWKTSQIRLEATKTVARWANEDRMAGRGPGARASFFWDTPHSPTDKRASFASLHSKKASTASVAKPVRPVSQIVPPLSTDVPATFGWSSQSSATHAVPNKSDVRSTSSPITAKHSAITKLQRQSGRAASLDLGSRPRVPASHRRTSTATELHNGSKPANQSKIIPTEASPRVSFDPWSSTTTLSPVEPISAPSTEKLDPWASLGALDTTSPPKPSSAVPDDDDDDWGEMVESPAVSTIQTPLSTVHTPLAESSQLPTCDNTVSTISTTPVSTRSSPDQSLPPPTEPVHASAIVRLQGTVSPTSALFKPNALVPTDSEERIGPHLLKKRDRSREATPEKATAVPVQMPTMDEVLSQPAKKGFREVNGDIESFVAATPTPPPQPTTAPHAHNEGAFAAPDSTPTPAPPVDEPNWGDDADFSIFESALPPSSSTAAPPPPPVQSDPTDPWSIFNSPIPSGPDAAFTRPVARLSTSPAKQPLTSTTDSAQTRKAEEDEVVRGIVGGLPNLGYMLRR